MWAKAKASAAVTADALEAQGYLGAEDDDARMAKEALMDAITVMRTEYNQRARLAAARMVLEFTMGKPAQQRGVTVKTAEKWIASIAAAQISSGEPYDATAA
jgi:hypothetical protein